MSTVDTCQKILCWLPDVKRFDLVHSEGVYEIIPMQECKDAGVRPLDLIWVDTDKSVDPAHKKIRSRLCAREYETKKQGKIQRTLHPFSVVLCNATSGSCEGACLNHYVGELVEQGKPLKLRHYDISRAHFQGTAQRLIYIRRLAEDRQKYGEDKVGRLVKSIY